MHFDPAQIHTLLMHAEGSLKYAYAPYSSFAVGAAVLLPDGTIVTGVNVENASSGVALCAERVAVGACVARGHLHFVALAVVAGNGEHITPCGICRQFLSEFDPDMLIISGARGAGPKLYQLSELLPHPFRRNPTQSKK